MRNSLAVMLMMIGERWTGPMAFRLILQPLMAILLATRDGLKDAREGRPPYLWTVLTSPADRVDLLRQGWKAVARVFVLAIIMDVIYQVIVYGWVYPLEVVYTAMILAFVPYILVRGPVTRIAQAFGKKREIEK